MKLPMKLVLLIAVTIVSSFGSIYAQSKSIQGGSKSEKNLTVAKKVETSHNRSVGGEGYNLLSDSTAIKIKIQELQATKRILEGKIAEEDKKRNAIVAGVSVASLEEMNNHQDSICLSLRSQLAEVNLELKELLPNPNLGAIMRRIETKK